MKDVEIEIKAKVEQVTPLLTFLEKNGTFISEKTQLDEYFSPAHRDYLASAPVKEWLRLRNTEGKITINYKYWHYTPEGKSYHCDEYETNIGDIETMKKVLNALDMKSIVAVHKKRKTWTYKEYEIAIDNVKSLGDFVEIEFKGNAEASETERIAHEMIAFLKQLGCGKVEINYQGYPHLLLFGKKQEFETH